jgi:hypothetical protein
MSRIMITLRAIATLFMPAHRRVAEPKESQSIEVRPACPQRDAEELEQGAREQSERSTCFLIAASERMPMGHGHRRGGNGYGPL